MGINSDSPLTTKTKRKFRAMVDAVIFANHLEHNYNIHHHQFHPKGGVMGQLVITKPRSPTKNIGRKFCAAVDAVILINHLKHKHHIIRDPRVNVGQHKVSSQPIMSHEERCQLMGRKFRASVKCVMLAQNLTTRMMTRRKFRAAVQLLIHSDQLMNRSIIFTRTTFQDAVLTSMSIKKLQQGKRLLLEQQQTTTSRDEQLKQRLCLAVEAILAANKHVGQWTHIPRTKVSRDETWKFIEEQVELEHSRKQLAEKFTNVGIGNHLVGNHNLGTNTNNSKYDCSPEFKNAVYHFLEDHNTE